MEIKIPPVYIKLSIFSGKNMEINYENVLVEPQSGTRLKNTAAQQIDK
jgi:hypothetical protein